VANAAGWQHRGQRGNSDRVAPRQDGVPRGLSPWLRVRRGVSQRGPSAQGDLRNARGGRRGQARPRRRGSHRASRADVARLCPRLGRPLFRVRARQRARAHAPRVPEVARHVRAALLRPRAAGARRGSCGRAALRRLADRAAGAQGPLSDRSVANALTPLRAVLGAAVADGLLAQTRSRAWCCRGVAAGARTSSRSGVS
jgi:hypothetical protein